MVKLIGGFVLAAVAGYLASVAGLTQHTLAEYAGIGLNPDFATAFETYVLNLEGLLSQFAVIQAVALLIAFLVAAGLKRVLTPLAAVAYPIAGAVAFPLLIVIVENTAAAGGAGAFYGARGPIGLALQGGAGLIAGIVFSLIVGGARK